MKKIAHADFIAWAKKHKWLHINEAVTPTGHQDTFLAPSGAFRIIIYDMSGNLHSVADPLNQAQSQQMMHIPNLDKLGKQ